MGQELRQDWSLHTVIAAHHLDEQNFELHWRYNSSGKAVAQGHATHAR